MDVTKSVENLLVIPARLGSTRLARKALLIADGAPLIVHTLRRATQSQRADRVVVATDSKEIVKVVEDAGFEAMMTSEDHLSGTDRVAEVAEKLQPQRIVNVQGDEPFIEPELIDDMFQVLEDNPDVPMATAVKRQQGNEGLEPTSVCKVVVNAHGHAMYFSRSMLPHDRDNVGASYLRHIGIYAYQMEYILTFRDLPPGQLENIEKLEQLRALENGDVIKVVETEYEGFSVDTEEDYKEFIGRMK